MSRSPSAGRGLLLVLALLLLARGAAVLALSDVFFYGEELEKGTVAKALLDGLPLPRHSLVYHPYEGGGFVVGHLAALAFLAFGQSLLALKVVGGLACAAVLLAGWRLLARHVSPRAGLLFGLLLVFAPESFQKLSLLCLGIHFEACVFVLLLLDGLLRWTLEDEPPRAPAAFLVGLTAGFGLYFSYQVAIVLAYALVVLLARRRDRLLGRPGAWALLGFALGASPLAWMVARVGSGVLDIHGTGLTELLGARSALGAFAGSLLGALSPALVLWSLLGAGAVLLSLGAGRAAGARRLLVGFLVLWLGAYLASSFVVGELRSHFDLLRFAPPWIVQLVLLAAVLDGGLRRGDRLRGLAKAVLVLALGLGAWSSVRIVIEGSWSTPRRNLHLLADTKGYDYGGWLAKVWPRLEGDDERRLDALERFDEPHPELLRAELAQVAWRHSSDRARLLGLLRGEGPERFAEYALGLGEWAVERGRERGGAGDELDRALAVAASEPEPLGPVLARALGRGGQGRAFLPETFSEMIRRGLQIGAPPELFEGLGMRAERWLVLAPYGGRALRLRPAALSAGVAGTDPRAAPHLLRGVELERRRLRLP